MATADVLTLPQRKDLDRSALRTRLSTLIMIRWLAIAGQSATVLFVALFAGQLALIPVAAAIGASVVLNLFHLPLPWPSPIIFPPLYLWRVGGLVCRHCLHRFFHLAHAADQKLDSLTIERRPPGPHDVQIETAYCGVCHSDLHQVRLDLDTTEMLIA